jgi:citrate synthase
MDARNIGLRNIEVADTRICSIDGENGKLIYRGYDILDLVNHSSFEETAYLLLFGELPSPEGLEDFSRRLREARSIPEPIIRNLKTRPQRARPMDVLQSCVSELADYDLNMEDDSKESNIRRAIILIAKIPMLIIFFICFAEHCQLQKKQRSLTSASFCMRSIASMHQLLQLEK